MKTLGRPKQFDKEVKTKLTDRQVNALDEIARERGVTRSDVIRQAVESTMFVMDKGRD